MKANPGGHIAPSDIIGRDNLIQNLWNTLERQSLVLCGERRQGKTCVIKKMVAEAPKEELLCVYRELEGVRTPLEFVEMVFSDVRDYLSGLSRAMKRVQQLLNYIGGTEVGDFVRIPSGAAPHWKDLLTKAMEDLAENLDRTVIFFWDEMPLMLYNIKKNKDDGEDTAMEILDTLRSLRQMHPRLRMVFTGSIGLHNVITSLKRAGYANDPTNDMSIKDVPALSPDNARELAYLLLRGEAIFTNDIHGTAQAISEAVDHVPFYIQHVFSEMRDRRDCTENEATVREIVKACLTDSHDRWHMRHYRERIDTYYSREESFDEHTFALKILDILSVSDKPLAFPVLLNLLKSSMETKDEEMTRHMLKLLLQDHYIIQQTDGTYQFRFPLIKRWWQLSRGVT